MSRLFRLAAFALFAPAAVVALPAPAGAAPDPLSSEPYTQPVPPPKCTRTQANSGDVGGCLLAFFSRPANDGYQTPLAPGDGDGWVWGGYNFNGSPALTEFETGITANTEPIGTIRTGSLETNALAGALFEGFLAEIQANGYRVQHASGYSYRCTGTWRCPSGDVDDLSLHAWGLAIDMNSATNPIRTYSAQNGASACDTPMVTDFPEWAIRTAERWGLYWGGYGWNSGCNVAGVQRSSVTRDAPHFEFRGTPAQAAAILRFNLEHNPNANCFDVVDADGHDAERCTLGTRPEATWRLPVTIDAPDGATAALVNLTATDAAGPGFLTIESCGGGVATERQTSTLTYAAGDSVATLAIAPLDDDGQFCVYRSSAVHSVVDVVGYLASGPDAKWLTPAVPTRLLDTRTDPGSAVPAGTAQPIPEADRDLLVNLAAVADSAPGFLQAGACGSLGAESTFSNVNYLGRVGGSASVRSNLALVQSGDEGACVFTLAAAHTVVDALATLGDTGLGWQVAPARRALDTRSATAPVAGELFEVDLAVQSPGVAVAITVTQAKRGGFVSLGRCADLAAQIAEAGHPTTSNVNFFTGQTVTNLAITAVDEGEVCAYTSAPAQVIVDVQAELTAEHEVGLVTADPERIHDSRSV